jgi:hypothetical protein
LGVDGRLCQTSPVAAPITTETIAAAARRLAGGGHDFTPRQLYYAVCAAVEQPRLSSPSGLIGLGLILILVGIITTPVHLLPLFPLLGGVGLALIALAAVNRRRERRRPVSSRPLAIGYDEFVAGPLAEAVAAEPDGLEGLIDLKAVAANRRIGARTRLLVCDRLETAAMLAANSAHLPAGVIALAEPSLGEGARGRRLHCLHDADPRGCELPARLRDAGAVEVADLGLLPPASDAGLQVIEGAPARLPRDLGADLTPAQVAWLRSGRRLELATRTPQEVVALIAEGLGAGGSPAPPVEGERGPGSAPSR